ncbi:hypothetical protein GE21DRAFT_1057341 [Neurospora crassa]|nr:hypothetical protein GE21DRAFT_1057341 [Neurospora crassa]
MAHKSGLKTKPRFVQYIYIFFSTLKKLEEKSVFGLCIPVLSLSRQFCTYVLEQGHSRDITTSGLTVNQTINDTLGPELSGGVLVIGFDPPDGRM